MSTPEKMIAVSKRILSTKRDRVDLLSGLVELAGGAVLAVMASGTQQRQDPEGQIKKAPSFAEILEA